MTAAAVAAPPTRGALLQAALNLASRGVGVMPLHRVEDGRCSCRHAADCPSAGKHPVHNWKSDPYRPTTDPDQIAQWWHAQAWNIGAEVPAGWLVVDPDARNGGPELLEKLAAGRPLDAWEDFNGTDAGRHYWLRLPAGYAGPTPGKLKGAGGLEIDLLWGGRAVVMPPSTHRAGGLRTWLMQSPGEPPEAPTWLLEELAAYAGSDPRGAGGGIPVPLPPEAAALLQELGARVYDPQAIVSACGGEWQRGGLEAAIRCPAHDDAHPSANLTIAPTGKVLWHCYAGCSQAALTAAIRAIPGALLPRPERKPAPVQVRKPGRVYRHRTDLRDVFAEALERVDYSLLPANPPGSDWHPQYGAEHGPSDRPALWAAAVRECSLYARGARADCAEGGGRVYFAGYIPCRFKLCPVCSTGRLMTKAHEHDRGWRLAGVDTFDVWRLEGNVLADRVALPELNAAWRRWRKDGAGAALTGASVLRVVNLSDDGLTCSPALLLAVPAGTVLTGWSAGPAELLAAGVGFDEVHEAQITAWGDTLAQVTDTGSLEQLLEVYARGTRVLEPIGAPRKAAAKAEKAAAEEEGVTLTEHRKAGKAPQGAPCPFTTERPHRHRLLLERFRYAQGRDVGGIWVLSLPAPLIEPIPPPTRRDPQLALV